MDHAGTRFPESGPMSVTSPQPGKVSEVVLSDAKIRQFTSWAAARMKNIKGTSNGLQTGSRPRKAIKHNALAGPSSQMADLDHSDDSQDDDNGDEEELGSEAVDDGIQSAQAIINKSGFNDWSDDDTKDPPRWVKPPKRKRTEEEKKIRKPDEFHYDGANRRNMAPKIVYPQDRLVLNRLKSRPWIQEAKVAQKAAQAEKTRTYITTDHLGTDDPDDIAFLQPYGTFAPRVIPKDPMPLKDRKRFFMYTPTAQMMKAMRDNVNNVHKLFNVIKNIDDCMLHPDPPPLHVGGGMRGVISCSFRWKDEIGTHEVIVNYGVVALLVNSRITAAQKEGWIEDAWHLSHLCGNWTCCNWRHHTIEDGPTNISRNGCFGSTKECVHKPPCMKSKKQKLVLPAHKSKLAHVAFSETTDDDVETVVEEDSEECSTDSGNYEHRESTEDKPGERNVGVEHEVIEISSDDDESEESDNDA